MARIHRIFVTSLGCPKNLIDTEVMCGALVSSGFRLVFDKNQADIMLVNTCAFIADARAEADEHIRAALRWKRRRKRRRVVVAGCLTQRAPAAVTRQYPGVDLFLGLDDVPRIAELLEGLLSGEHVEHDLSDGDSPSYLYDHRTPRLTLTAPSFAYVKIAEGCDHRCAYCTIPAIRGRQRSRDPDSVIEECRQLLDQGRKELVLIAQDTSRYGAERSDGASLAALVEKIDALPGDFWIRILYTHPLHVDIPLLECLAAAAHVVPYLDIPLQHISTPVLNAMRRGIDGEATRRLMDAVRKQWPGVTVRTTFLVGFPGETEKDFQELLAYAARYRFERLGVFTYSPEEGTPAARQTEHLVPPAEAERRRDALMTQQVAIAAAHNDELVGRTLRILADVEERPGHYRGRTAADAPDIDNIVHFRGPAGRFEGGFADVRIDTVDTYDLYGKVDT